MSKSNGHRELGKNEKLGLRLVVHDLRQRHLEAWSDAFNKYSDGRRGIVHYHGAVLRASIEAEWLVEPVLSVEDVGEMSPQHARWYAVELDKLYTELTTVPND